MPVPPIYQPEIPAEAGYWAAHHRRRELWVGYSTVLAILGNRLAPSFADWYLAKTGFSGQQISDMPVSAERPDNLFEPVPSLAATHGMFDDQAKTRCPQLWAATHRRPPRRRGGGDRRRGGERGGENRQMNPASPCETPLGVEAPHVLREYALLADGERGVLVGPRGDFA